MLRIPSGETFGGTIVSKLIVPRSLCSMRNVYPANLQGDRLEVQQRESPLCKHLALDSSINGQILI